MCVFYTFGNNAKIDDKSSLDLLQNDLSYSSKNIIEDDSLNENSQTKYIQKRQAIEKPKKKISIKKKPNRKPPSKRTTPKKTTPKKPPTKKPPTKKPPTKKPLPKPTTKRPAPRPTTRKPITRPTTKKPSPKTTTTTPDKYSTFRSKILTEINKLRKEHQAPSLTVDTNLVKEAQKRVDEVLKNQTYQALDDDLKGELFYAVTEDDEFDPIERWIFRRERLLDDEHDEDYYSNPDFTQMIWSSTKKIGCAFQKDEEHKYILTVCLLSPKGNIEGEFEKNIRRSNRTITRNKGSVEEYPELKSKLVKDINKLRQKHQARQLTVDAKLAQKAQEQVNRMLLNEPHRWLDDNTIGEVFYIARSKSTFDPLSFWTLGSEKIQFDDIENSSYNPDFIQLIWASTTKIGCGIGKNTKRADVLTLCYISPRGLIRDQLKENVRPPVGR